jgi:hypothetical protein
MILDLRIDLETMEVKLLSIDNLNKEDIIAFLLDYYKLKLSDIIDSQKDDSVICKQFITYWLIEIFDTPAKEIKNLLGYKENSSIISVAHRRIHEWVFISKDLRYVRSYNNHVRFLAKLGVKRELIET